MLWYIYFLIIIFFLNHYAPVSQANWCNVTFTTGNIFPSHSCIGLIRVKAPLGCPDINLNIHYPITAILILTRFHLSKLSTCMPLHEWSLKEWSSIIYLYYSQMDFMYKYSKRNSMYVIVKCAMYVAVMH